MRCICNRLLDVVREDYISGLELPCIPDSSMSSIELRGSEISASSNICSRITMVLDWQPSGQGRSFPVPE